MNKHFHDSRYYLTRAAEHARLGIAETLAPVSNRVRDRLGRSGSEPESEPDRLETVREEVAGLERKVEGQAREAIGSARERVTAYRGEASATDERKP
ncbi:DUF7553 family protein [Halopiger aswanensis]|uniref:Uncharacterized protein n=1 Tax=Halopiger aswanensis TaxID=148449 RepID=A0A419WHH1_9EURY|nr:hypothetical protein [Halopiger aswanensis]RKD94909.1 hypothetical protein ATJ93_1753 [Halopiger aswanensis]